MIDELIEKEIYDSIQHFGSYPSVYIVNFYREGNDDAWSAIPIL